MPLTGYEETSVVEVGAVLDTSPATAEEVYLRTIGHSERAIAAVAAKRAGTAGANFNGGTITDPLVVATNPGEQPLSIQPQGVETLAIDQWGDAVITQTEGGDPLTIINSDGNTWLQTAGAAGQVTVLGWNENGNVLYLSAPDTILGVTPHLISFDTHDGSGNQSLDLGNVRVGDYGTDDKQSVILLRTTRNGESGGNGGTELLGEGEISLVKPEHSTSTFLTATDAAAGVDRFTLSKTGTIVNRLASGASLTVQNSAGAAIFRIDENGSVHIKNGTTIQADL